MPAVRQAEAGQAPERPASAVVEIGESAGRARPGEIAPEAERPPPQLGRPDPRFPARVAPTPAASPVAAGEAYVSEPEVVGRAAPVMPEPTRPAALTPLLQGPTERPEPEPIEVRIGTVEVRAATPPPAPAPAAQGFDDYAAIRSYAGWG